MAAAMAKPCPVLPEVGSTIVPPAFSMPARSAASIIRKPMRSLTLPPGFSISSLARMVGLTPRVTLCRRTSGVSPTASRNVSMARILTAPFDVRGRVPRVLAAPCGSADCTRGRYAIPRRGHGGQWTGRREVEALAHEYAQLPKSVELRLGLDPFRHDGRSGLFRECDEGGRQRALRRIAVDVDD